MSDLARDSRRPRLGAVQSPKLTWSLAIAACIACAAVLYLTSYKTFYVDEWAFVTTRRDWSWDTLLLSHNGHWSTLFVLAWKLLFVAFGIGSHLPYQAAALVAHVSAVFALFALIRRHAGDLPAFAAATILLVLGRGAENIDWAFQLAWCASVALGLAALVLLDASAPPRRRGALASAALLCSLMFSNVGLIFVGVVAIELALDRDRRRELVVLIVPVIAFALWFLVYDTGSRAAAPGVSGQIGQGPHGIAYLAALGAFVADGIAATAAGLFSLPPRTGAIVLAIVVAIVVADCVRRRRIPGWEIALALGLVAWFVLVGLGRLQYGAAYAQQGRYVYVGAIFLLPLLAAGLRNLPWHGPYRPILGTVFIACVFANALQLRADALSQTGLMKLETAELQTVQDLRGAPDMALNVPIDNDLMPTLAAGPYLAAVDQLGSPVPTASFDELRRNEPYAVERVMVDLFGSALKATSGEPASANLPCRRVDASNGTVIALRVPNAGQLLLTPSGQGMATLFLGFLGPPGAVPASTGVLQAAAPSWIHIPDAGRPITWQVRIKTSPIGTLDVCGDVALQVQDAGNGVFSADAATGLLSPGWVASADPAASGGRAAQALAGVYSSFNNAVFMDPLAVPSRPYDVWYRVRVSSTRGNAPEMTLGLWADQEQAWVAKTEYPPAQLTTRYSWVEVASDVIPPAGDSVQFIASFSGRLQTDWFVDDAVMQPAGSPPPR